MEKITIKTKSNLDFPSIVFGNNHNCENLVIYLGGCGAIKDISLLFGIKEQKLNYQFVCFDYRGCGESKLKSSRLNSRYAKDIYLIIDSLKKIYKNVKNIYIAGESWGGNLAMIFQKKFPNIVSGYVLWNSPTKVVNNTTKVTLQEHDDSFLSISIKTLFTLFTNIDTKLKPPGVEQLANDLLYTRSIRIGRAAGNYINARMILAAWFSMYPSWKFMKKHFKKDSSPKFVLIQSGNDIYYKKNILTLTKLQKLETKNNKIFILENGSHVLSVEKNNSQIIWQQINEMILQAK